MDPSLLVKQRRSKISNIINRSREENGSAQLYLLYLSLTAVGVVLLLAISLYCRYFCLQIHSQKIFMTSPPLPVYAAAPSQPPPSTWWKAPARCRGLTGSRGIRCPGKRSSSWSSFPGSSLIFQDHLVVSIPFLAVCGQFWKLEAIIT